MYSSATHNETSAPMNNNNNSGMADAGDKPKKRIRRTAGEINRRFVCFCGKAYGSEGSLNQHKKNKNHFQPGQQIVKSGKGQLGELAEGMEGLEMPVHESYDFMAAGGTSNSVAAAAAHVTHVFKGENQ